jgi:hypothetical protein
MELRDMALHANAAIRAYLKIAGLPEPDARHLDEVRRALLGNKSADPDVVLSITATKDDTGVLRALAEANLKIMKG